MSTMIYDAYIRICVYVTGGGSDCELPKILFANTRGGVTSRRTLDRH